MSWILCCFRYKEQAKELDDAEESQRYIYMCVCLYMHAFTSAHKAHVKRDRFAGSKRVYELLDKPDRH